MRTKHTIVILVSGKAGSGKTTVSDFLESKLTDIPSMRVFRYSFASPLKYIAKAYIGWDGAKDEKGRKLLQDLGKVGREYDKEIWAKHLISQLDKKSGLLPFNFVIVDDWRFPNELAYLQTNPLFSLYTIRVSGKPSELPGNTAFDISENSLPDIPDNIYNRFINNEGDLSDLEQRVDEVVKDLTERFILE